MNICILKYQNFSHIPLEAVEFVRGAEVKSPHGSPESNAAIIFVVFPPEPDIELRDVDDNADIGGAGAVRSRSPSKSILDESEGAFVAEFELPEIFRKF